MLSVISSAVTALKLYRLRRKQYDSVELRQYFKKKHNIDVGLYSYGCFDRWRMPGPLRIGRYCSIARTVRSTNNNHPIDALTTHPALYDASFGAVDHDHVWEGSLLIEDDVWIGHNAVILPGCRIIGRGAVIGAGSIVTRDVDRYAVMAGNPARRLRDRFPPDVAAAIEATRWWECDVAGLRQMIREHPQAVYKPDVLNLAALAKQMPT